MFKYLRTSSAQGFERLWIWGNMNPSFFKFPPSPPPLSECNQYKFLNDSDRRNDFGRGKKCDNYLAEDWYRFSAGAGTSIATKCISKGQRYGTDLPGWMDGARPTVDEGVVSRKVCFSGYQNCCYRHIMINVRNCSSFFVYRLKPVQVCHSRYCGGKARGWNTNLLFEDTVYHYTLIFSRLFNLPLN